MDVEAVGTYPASRPSWVQRLDTLHLLTPIRIAVVVAFAILATLFVHRLVAKTLRRVLARTLPDDQSRAEARRRALSSALRAALVGVIWTVAVITVISEVGVNIGGFVATATVVGGAIAFGAQTLIRDVIAGFFILADDVFGVGDEVDLGHASGTVERVTLRTATVRDGEGRMWYVPHGNVVRVGNLSKAGIAVLQVDVARAMPIDDALAALDRVGTRLVDDPSTSARLLGRAAVGGVTAFDDDRYVVEVTVATLPRERDAVKRAWRAEILRAYAAGDLLPPERGEWPRRLR